MFFSCFIASRFVVVGPRMVSINCPATILLGRQQTTGFEFQHGVYWVVEWIEFHKIYLGWNLGTNQMNNFFYWSRFVFMDHHIQTEASLALMSVVINVCKEEEGLTEFQPRDLRVPSRILKSSKTRNVVFFLWWACFFSHCLRWSISNYKFCTSIMLTSRKEDLMYYKDNGRITIRWKQDVFGSTPATQATLTAIGLRMRLAPDWQYVSLFRSATLHVWCSFLSYVFTRLCLHYIYGYILCLGLHVPGFTFLRQLQPWTRSDI